MTKICEKYSDYRISHFDKRDPIVIPTFNDLDRCIDFLEELFKKYYSLFRATIIGSLPPTFQYDWMAIFEEPWILK